MALSLLSSKCYADENNSDRNRHWMGRVEVLRSTRSTGAWNSVWITDLSSMWALA